MTFKQHAIMRCAQRLFAYDIISDRTWAEWKKANQEKVEEVEKTLKEHYEHPETEIITIASYQGQPACKFYINKELMCTFVVEKSGKAVITYYPVDFQLGDPKTNSKMLQVLFEALREHKKRKEELEIRINDRNFEIDEEVSVLNAQKEAIETKLNHIREIITQRKAEKVASKAELDSCSADIRSIEEKIVRSKFAT